MISKISLRNWKSHLNSEFVFSEGTNVLVGIMGSGKSSVLDAICFALFGTFPDLQNRKVKLDDVIMSKPKKQKEAVVTLTLQLDKEYTITRTVERGKGTSTSEIREQGRLIEAPQSQRVTEVIEHLLKVDYELFSRAIYSEQNQLDYFLTLPKGKRMKKIDELLRLDKFEKARGNATSLANRCRQQRNDKKQEVDRLKGEGFIEKIPELQKDLNDKTKQRELLKKQLNELSSRITVLSQRIEQLEKSKELLSQAERDKAVITASIRQTRDTIEKLRKKLGKEASTPLEDLEKGYEILMSNLEELEMKLSEKRERLEMLQAEGTRIFALINQKNNQMGEIKKSLAERDRTIKELKRLEKENPRKQLRLLLKEIERENATIEKNRLIIEQNQESLEKLSGDKCPVCDTKLTKTKKEQLITDRKRQMSSAAKSINESQKKITQLLKKQKILEEKISRFDTLKERVSSFQDLDLKSHLEEIKELKKRGKEIDENIILKKKLLERLEKKYKEEMGKKSEFQILLTQRKELEEKLELERAYENRLSSVETTLSKTKFDPEELKQLRKEHQNIVALERETEVSINSLADLISERQQRLVELKERRSFFKDLENEIEELSEIVDFLERFNNALLETQEQLRNEFVQAINSTMDEVWSELYPYRDFQSIRLAIEGGDYVLQLQSGGTWVPVEGFTSGGERSSAVLCLRIAFALVLTPNLKWLILDEPTHNLDVNAIDSFAEVLKTKVSEIVEQVFVITHEERLEEAVTGTLYRLERDKSIDGESKVISLST